MIWNGKYIVNAEGGTFNILHRNDRLFIIGNGRGDDNRSNAFEVSNNGHSIVFDNLGNNVGTVASISTRPPIVGATYKDNIPCAWGYIDQGGLTKESFGVASSTIVNSIPLVEYTITLDYKDPYTGLQKQMKAASITATLVYDPTDGTASTYHCASIVTTPISWASGYNVFKIRIYDPKQSDCPMIQHQFMFQVIARPM